MTNYLLPAWLEPATAWIIPAAFLLDRLFGDPHSLPHPVRLIGGLLKWLEPPLRSQLPPLVAGSIGVMLCLSFCAGCVVALLSLPAPFNAAAAIYLSFAGLAIGQLGREGRQALGQLQYKNVEAARASIAMLVSRELTVADESELSRALAETLSENFNDGFVAPLFWLAIGGPVGLWLYKGASTMDSCWGYPYEPWTLFGRTAAHLDDLLAYVPARLCVPLIYVSSRSLSNPKWPGWACIRRQARTMKSPNAGWPMAACAWVTGARMGGPTRYAGTMVEKPTLGPGEGTWSPDRLALLIRLLDRASILAVILAWPGCLLMANLLRCLVSAG